METEIKVVEELKTDSSNNYYRGVRVVGKVEILDHLYDVIVNNSYSKDLDVSIKDEQGTDIVSSCKKLGIELQLEGLKRIALHLLVGYERTKNANRAQKTYENYIQSPIHNYKKYLDENSDLEFEISTTVKDAIEGNSITLSGKKKAKKFSIACEEGRVEVRGFKGESWNGRNYKTIKSALNSIIKALDEDAEKVAYEESVRNRREEKRSNLEKLLGEKVTIEESYKRNTYGPRNSTGYYIKYYQVTLEGIAFRISEREGNKIKTSTLPGNKEFTAEELKEIAKKLA